MGPQGPLARGLLSLRRNYPVIFIIMALVKCSECGKEVSDKAVACPFCGNPVGGTPVTIELTSKKWKKWVIVAFVLWFIALCFIGSNASFALLLFIIGFITLIVASIGAWWTNG